MKKKGMIYTIIFTFLTTLIFLSILAMVNELTMSKVERNQELVLIKSMLNAFNIQYNDEEDAYNKFNSYINKQEINDIQIYINSSNELTKNTYAVIFSGNGLWGTINGVLAVYSDFSRIIGIDILNHNETPGLGGRIDEHYFKEQFRNEKLINNKISMKISGPGDNDHENGRVDAITGATRTSELFESMINVHLEKLKNVLEILNE